MHKLSQSESVHKTAINQTKGWWHTDTQRHGYTKREILTVGNVVVSLKLPYVVQKKQKKAKNKSTHVGFCPLLKWLGMSEGLTPLVWSDIAKYGAITSSFEAAHTILDDWGINISVKRIERLTYKFGQIGIGLRQTKISNLQQGKLPDGNILKDQRVVIAVDGESSRRCRFPSRRTGEPEGR